MADFKITESEQFLNILDPKTDKFSFQCFHHNNKIPPSSILHGTLKENLDALIRYNNDGYGVYVTVNQTDLKGRKIKNIKKIRAIWQEDDGAGKKLPIKPDLVINTSPGKKHVYIFTKKLSTKDITKERFDGVQKIISSEYGGDKNAKDITRVLRLPGFYNTKRHLDTPYLVNIGYVKKKIKRREWSKIISKIGTISEREKGNGKNGEKSSPSFNSSQAIEEIANAKSYYQPMLSWSMTLANSGLDKGAIVTLLKMCLDLGRLKRPEQDMDIWQERYEGIRAMARSAIEKVSEEKLQSHIHKLLITPSNWPSTPKQPIPIVSGAISINSLSSVFGEWGSYKTFSLLYLAYCIATGRKWFNRKTYKTPVLYIAAEGASDVLNRINALKLHYQEPDPIIYLFPEGITLDSFEGIESLSQLSETIFEQQGKWPLVIVDTLARNSSGEESNEAYNKLVSKIQHTIGKLNQGILFVHHTGHRDKNRSRGGSSFAGAIDHEFKVKKTNSEAIIECTKNREGEDGWKVTQKLAKVDLNYKDCEGKNVSTLIVKEAQTNTSTNLKEGSPIKNVSDYIMKAEHQQVFWNTFKESYEEDKEKATKLFGYKNYKSLYNSVNEKYAPENNWKITPKFIQHTNAGG